MGQFTQKDAAKAAMIGGVGGSVNGRQRRCASGALDAVGLRPPLPLLGDGQAGWTVLRDCGLPEIGLPFTWGIALADANGDDVLDVAAGSGGIVATNPDYKEPVVPAGLLVWTAQLR